jgi:hypothetical protein
MESYDVSETFIPTPTMARLTPEKTLGENEEGLFLQNPVIFFLQE